MGTREVIIILLTFTFFTVITTATPKEPVTVTAPDGTYIGYIFRIETLGRRLAARRFLGIPYAEAPIGQLRFNKPKRKAKLTQPHDATEHGASCAQQMIDLGGPRKPGMHDALRFSEDCLFLNIYSPVSEAESGELLPVMIFIHGGGFNIGTPTTYNSDIPSAYGNIIIVTVTYRLALWGFVSTGDEHLPGNYGLWDQQMAIEWVYDNIEAFGGDRSEITVAGHSAGGASTIYQTMYPGNKGKIKRAILMSGSITCPWAFNSNPLRTAKRFAKLVNCDTNVSTKDLAECLRAKPFEDLNRVLNTRENGFVEFPMQFVSVVDGDFIPETPYSILHGSSEEARQYRDNLQAVDMMTGITSEEGLMMLNSFVGVYNTETYEADRAKFETELVPEVARIVFGEHPPEIVERLIIAEYTNWTNRDDGLNPLKSYITLSGDYVLNIQTIETALLHAGGSDSKRSTYLYLYDIFPSTRIALTPPWNSKPQHGDEMTTLFGYNGEDGYTAYTTPFLREPREDWENDFIKLHITLWTNFVKSG